MQLETGRFPSRGSPQERTLDTAAGVEQTLWRDSVSSRTGAAAVSAIEDPFTLLVTRLTYLVAANRESDSCETAPKRSAP